LQIKEKTMKYDFDTITDRQGTNSLKWDISDGELPMWVADMDFRTAPEIISAIEKRAAHGVFGYTVIPDRWYSAYINWWSDRHNFTMDKSWLMFCTGVVPAVSSIVRKLTTPNENVLIQTPVYNIFFNSIENNGCRVLENPLKYDGENYHIDFADLEKKLSDPQTTLMILCNPQNPTGRVWDREILAKIGDLAYDNGVVVISDEIHCDLTEPGCEYTPFASVSEKCRQNSITCIAPTKAFNIAGLQTSAISVPDPRLRHKVWRAINTDEAAEPNAFAVDAAIAAFDHGGEWLDELRTYIFGNQKLVAEYLKKEIPQIKLVSSRATYLLWLDCSSLGIKSDRLAAVIREKTGLYLSSGNIYGKGGEHFLRMNIACPRSMVEDGLGRLKKAVYGI